MSPGEIILLFALLLCLLTYGLTIFLSLYKKKKERAEIDDMRKRGSENAIRIQELCELKCSECGREVNPEDGDVFYQGNWWCKADWEAIFDNEYQHEELSKNESQR